MVQVRFGFVSGYRFNDTGSPAKSTAPSGAELVPTHASYQRRFVSRYRFSDTASPATSDAPLGAAHAAPEKQNPPCQRFWRVGFGSAYDF